MRPGSKYRAAYAWTTVFIFSLVTCSFCWAQSTQGEPEDLDFEIINVTTGQPGTIDRLEIDYSTVRLDPVLDVEPEGTSFTVPDVPIKDVGKYIVTAWKSGVPYFWSLRGRKLIDGPITLHVFDVTSDLSDITIPGMNVLIRKRESVLDLEIMLKVNNTARPQVTVLGSPSLELIIPAGVEDLRAYYTRGPEPIDIPLHHTGGNRLGLEVPLTTGQNQIRLTCSMPWREGMKLPIGSNLAVDNWSLLATPVNLSVSGWGLEQDTSQELSGFLRFIGPPLEAGRELSMELKERIPAGQAEEVFETEAPADLAEASDPTEEENDGSSFPVPVFIAIFVVLIAVIARKRRS